MRTWLATAALVVATLAVFELLCRWFIGFAPRERFDPRYDRLPRPDQPTVQSHEGFSHGRTNELGHLDETMPSPLPPDGILVIGDSFTEARHVARAERFTDRLGALLHRRVYNVGHTGWSPINALGFLTAERARFAPATVIVQISGNDAKDLVTAKRPHVVRRDGELAIVWPAREKTGMAARITAAREAISARSALAGDVLVAALTLLKAGGGDDEAAGASDEPSCGRPDPLVAEAMPWLLGELGRAHPDVRLLYLPSLDYHAGCVDRCAASRAIFRAAAEARAMPMIDVTEAMCAWFARTRQPLNGFANTVPGTGHFNADGHDVIARQLAAELAGRPGAR